MKDNLIDNMADTLKKFVADNSNRFMRGQDVNWALIHEAGALIAEYERDNGKESTLPYGAGGVRVVDL